jgi:hemolysin D
VLQAAWQHRIELAGPKRLADEAAFLPAALSLQETPVHPAPRRLAWALMALFVVALAWACLGHVDIVAVAPGRVIVAERSKLVQPLEPGVVRRIFVKDGDVVQAGQALIELDPTTPNADQANLQEQRQAAESEAWRCAELLTRLSRKKLFAGVATSFTPQEFYKPSAPARALLQAELADIQSKRLKFDTEIARRRAEIATVQQTIAKLEATLPMLQARETDYKDLVKDGFVSSHATQDKTRERVEQERDLATQLARQAEARTALAETRQAQAAWAAETIRSLHHRHATASTQLAQLLAEGRKADHKAQLTLLSAPVDGVVQQLATHTVGGVVTVAQPLMVIVPQGSEVTAEVAVANLDIGFVNAGQAAEIKLETFPYTRYGTVAAQVIHVSADAVADDKRGTSYFPATLQLGQKVLNIDGKQVAISPGMNITAEIKTGRRRMIEFLLSPVQQAGRESLRER